MEETVMRLARAIDQKRYGKFRGFVTNNEDPEKRGRLKLLIPSVLSDQESDWALPCVPYGGFSDQGFFAIPNVDAQVWVEFEEGNPQRPIWTGTFWQQESDVPKEAALDKPTTHLLKTPSGHVLQFDDEDGKEKIKLHHQSNSEITLDENGSIQLTDSGGGSVYLDAENNEISIVDANGNTLTMSSAGTTAEDSNGNKIEMAAAGITIDGQKILIKGSQIALAGEGGEPLIKGQSFLSLFATHMHPTAMGPSGPPIPQGEASTLSSKVLTT